MSQCRALRAHGAEGQDGGWFQSQGQFGLTHMNTNLAVDHGDNPSVPDDRTDYDGSTREATSRPFQDAT